MSKKHTVYNTGFSGAKLVVDAIGDPSDVDEIRLMDSVAKALAELQGAIYTGCDLGTTEEDMTYLSSLTPYVLASIENPVDANASTGHGVFGSIQGALDSRGGVAGKTFLVKGTGKVGSVTAQLLAGAGGRVLTYDINAAAADIPGCENVSHMDWRDVECDVFVPCSVSGFINEDVASRLKCSLVIGASNVPFADGAALSALLARGIDFVPEAVSSAGAVLGDSIELYAADAYRHARPSQVYAFVRSLTRQKTRELFEAAAERGRPAALCLGDVEEDPSSEPCGTRFRAFVEDATEEVDTLVIGAGMAGTAAAYYLTKDAPGHRVAVVESRSVANQWASSHGQSRMYRRMYSDAYFSQMQSRALELWREIEAERGVALLRENGLLFYGETDTGETVEGSVPGARAVMEELGIPHEYFDTGAAMAERWPDMKADEAFQGVFEATAGKIDSSLACRAMVDGAVERGARLYENEAVVDLWIDRKGAMHAATSQGRFFRAGKVVVAAGGWTRRVLQHLNVDMDLEVHSVAYGHYRVRDVETAARMPQWFCFRKKRGELDGGLYFGFPPEDPSVPVIKCGIDFTPDAMGLIRDSMSGFKYQTEKEIAKLMDDFFFENWPCIEERLDIQCSPYTMTRDQYFVLGEIPDMPQVIVFSGGCGRAFKFGPLLGQCLADLALGKEPSYDIAPLSPSRPAVGLQVTPVTPHTASLSPAAAARRAAVQRDLARTA